MAAFARKLDFLRSLMPVISRLRSVSFSQFGEDVLLYTLCPRRAGFYVDVGAYHPWKESNTYKLYLRGWTGITIEPNPDVAHFFRRVRPRDLHLNIGIADQHKELCYYRFKDAKLNTFSEAQTRFWLDQLATRPIAVRCLPLREVLIQHCSGQHIDLLSVDCEGFDFQVLQSIDWTTTRPTVILVEDMVRLRQHAQQSALSSGVADFLLEQGYTVVGQALFNYLYVDGRAIRGQVPSPGFALEQSQVNA